MCAFDSDEPLIHSHMDDVLPDDHPLANDQVCCLKCGGLVHAANNECMSTWVEIRKKPFCLSCAAPVFQKVLTYGPLLEYLEP